LIHLNGNELFADDVEGFRRKIIDEGEGPIRSYAYTPAHDGELPYHCHSDSVEIHLIVEGSATMVVDGEEFPIAAPDIIVVEPGEFHSIRRDGSAPFHLLAVVSPNQDDLVWPPDSSAS
jgi:mannose-6-phosphate isomerase-like protein (cupin superfamily)